MCGISGFISQKNRVDAQVYYSAHSELSHRGPDDEGFYVETDKYKGFAIGSDSAIQDSSQPNICSLNSMQVVLGHRRLSIIDLTSAGHQPLKHKSKIITYNGEIYNYIELKEELQSLGYKFKTSTDTEVFLLAFDHWGEKAFGKLNGMWAAAIYDLKTYSLVLTRDRFGIKPLYYSFHENGLYFASEIKFFKKLDLIKEVNEESIFQYLRYSEVDFNKCTFFKNIFQLEPGSYLNIKGTDHNFCKYWDINNINQNIKNVLSIKSVLKDAIKLRLRADVGVGSLLSGGIDSSLIVGCIKEIIGLKNFKSYSAVFTDEKYSEKNYIDNNSKYLDFKPYYVYPKSSDLIKNIELLLYIQEMPFRSLSVLSQFLIYQEVAKQKKVKVLLNGQGADEIFTGYNAHYSYYFLFLIKNFKLIVLFREFRSFCITKKLSFYSALIKVLKDLFYNYLSRANNRKIFRKDFKKCKIPKYKNKFSSLKNKLFHDLSFSALPEYLRYEDRNSMYFSLESRLPFLDFRLVQTAFALPNDKYIINGITKYPLRKISRGLVDKSIIERKDKTGFVSPQEVWQKTILTDEFDAVFDDIAVNGLFNFIDHKSVYKTYTDYKSNIHDDWAFIWRIYCLYKWKKVWLS